MMNISATPIASNHFVWCSVFSEDTFSGNQTMVIRYDSWPNNVELARVATYLGIHEVTFFVLSKDCLEVRWFMGEKEVPLCGHGALAVAHLLKDCLKPNKNYPVHNLGDRLYIRSDRQQRPSIILKPQPVQRCQKKILEFDQAYYTERDYIFVLPDLQTLISFEPTEHLKTLDKIACVLTAQDENNEIYFRFFVPNIGLYEDNASASVLPSLLTLWEIEQGKEQTFYQIKDKRIPLKATQHLFGIEVRAEVHLFAKGELISSEIPAK